MRFLKPKIPMRGFGGAAWLFAMFATLMLASTPASALTFAEAADLFGTEYGDAYTSIFLNQLFGPLFPAANGSQTETVFSIIIGIFNIIIVGIGGLMLFHNFTVGILQSAQEGQILGRRWSSLWAPLRIIFAIGMVVPTAGMEGYNLAQTGVAYIVRGSTNIASLMWKESATLVISGQAPITASPPVVDTSAINTMYQNAACKAIVNDQFITANNGSNAVRVVTQTYQNTVTSAATTTTLNGASNRTTHMTYLQDANGELQYAGICGYSTTPELPGYLRKLNQTEIDGIPSSQVNALVTAYQSAYSTTLATLQSELDVLAATHLSTMKDSGASLPNMSSEIATIYNAANNNLETRMDNILDQAVGVDRIGQTSRDALLARITGGDTCSSSASANPNLTATNPDGTVTPTNEAINCYGEGWIGAGSWYMMMAQLNNEIATLTSGKVSAVAGSYINGMSSEQLYIANGGEGGWFGYGNAERATEAGFATTQEAELWNARYNEAYNSSVTSLAALGFPMSSEDLSSLNMSATGDGGVLEKLAKFGGYQKVRELLFAQLLDATSPSNWSADPMIGLVNIGHTLINLAGKITAATFAVGLIPGFSIGASVAAMISPFVALMVTAGATLAIILPIMPFVFWVLAVTGYFLLIVEAVVAVNLWALAHMRLDGDGISGEAGRNGWLMLLSLLVTPTLMVLGLLVGMAIFRITSALIDVGLHQAVSGMFGGGFFSDIATMLAFSFLIVVFYMVLLERSFALVSEFPGRVLRWMGADAQLTRGEEERARATAIGAMAGMYQTSNRVQSGAYGAGQKLGMGANINGAEDPAQMQKGAMRKMYDRWKTEGPSKGDEKKDEDDGGGTAG